MVAAVIKTLALINHVKFERAESLRQFRLAARANEWPYPFPPMETTYSQSIPMMRRNCHQTTRRLTARPHVERPVTILHRGGIPSFPEDFQNAIITERQVQRHVQEIDSAVDGSAKGA